MIYGGKHNFKLIFKIQKQRIRPSKVNACYIDYTHIAWNDYFKHSQPPTSKLSSFLIDYGVIAAFYILICWEKSLTSSA